MFEGQIGSWRFLANAVNFLNCDCAPHKGSKRKRGELSALDHEYNNVIFVLRAKFGFSFCHL
jgi:hypothetical protein